MMPAPIESSLLIFGGIILIGYVGELVSRRFSLPSALLLLGIGQALRLSGYADVPALSSIQEIFGTLALIILLFDGGLSLNIHTVIFRSGRVALTGAAITALSILACSLFFAQFAGIDPLIGAIFGAIAGGIGSTTTISVIRGLSVQKEIADFLTLEASITDVFSIILTLVFTAALVSGSLDLQFLGQGVAIRFSVGLVLGAALGIMSLMILSKIQKGYNYVVTFALMLSIYSLTELLAGSGAIAVLVFGVIFGNETAIRRVLRIGSGERNFTSKSVQAEISFFIRTFFLVFMGVVVSLGSITNLLYAAGLMLLLYAIRFVSVKAITSGSQYGPYADLLTAVNPRGLATAVLATYPIIEVQKALADDAGGRLSALLSELSGLLEICFYTIVLSILLTSVFVPIAVSRLPRKDAQPDLRKKPKPSS